ncbi:hypothetical protein T02_10700 [Trichinella nativa]|uniref:Uncharacterized protein n=1 Tax=Trichinella nativa TaxID=6335 RepID=A0A0V1LIF3_9BILA|nr:hypothetical protein T02_10700 [Trichinella nativa]
MSGSASDNKKERKAVTYPITTTDQCSHPSRPLIMAFLGIFSPCIPYDGLLPNEKNLKILRLMKTIPYNDFAASKPQHCMISNLNHTGLSQN